MDTIPAQEIPAQEIPIQPPIVSSPVQNLPQKTNFRKFFNVSSWVILFALLPITVLIFLSQDSIPGDFFYPVKRGMENVILAAASVSPVTRAAFRTDLTEVRFKEAQSLVVLKSNASGLTTFIDEVQGTKQEVASLKNDTERKKAEEKLAVKIQEYQNGLSSLEAKTEQAIIASIPPTSVPNLPLASPTFTPAPTPTPVSEAASASPEHPAPTIAPTTIAPQPENNQITQQRRIVESIKETKENLDKIKKELEEKRREEKEKREERNEREKKDKEDKGNKEKRDSSDGHR